MKELSIFIDESGDFGEYNNRRHEAQESSPGRKGKGESRAEGEDPYHPSETIRQDSIKKNTCIFLYLFL